MVAPSTLSWPRLATGLMPASPIVMLAKPGWNTALAPLNQVLPRASAPFTSLMSVAPRLILRLSLQLRRRSSPPLAACRRVAELLVRNMLSATSSIWPVLLPAPMRPR